MSSEVEVPTYEIKSMTGRRPVGLLACLRLYPTVVFALSIT